MGVGGGGGSHKQSEVTIKGRHNNSLDREYKEWESKKPLYPPHPFRHCSYNTNNKTD